ncbi:MAG: hypothetical protein JSW54_10835 [Fidelibacterota bacterium]|nr:MAG: hypothetical protein JSW54_10835 [Candidatus Neomarinimicrobiota bacterium]
MVSALPDVENGRVTASLGALGMLTVDVGGLHIGQDLLRLPLSLHPQGRFPSKSIDATVHLTDWRIDENTIWCTVRQIGGIQGALLQAVKGALPKLVTKVLTQKSRGAINLKQRQGQLGLSIEPLMRGWAGKLPEMELTRIELRGGIILYFQ